MLVERERVNERDREARALVAVICLTLSFVVFQVRRRSLLLGSFDKRARKCKQQAQNKLLNNHVLELIQAAHLARIANTSALHRKFCLEWRRRGRRRRHQSSALHDRSGRLAMIMQAQSLATQRNATIIECWIERCVDAIFNPANLVGAGATDLRRFRPAPS